MKNVSQRAVGTSTVHAQLAPPSRSTTTFASIDRSVCPEDIARAV